MSPTSLEYLQHIRDECDYIEGRMIGLTKQEFMQDATLQRSFVRSIEVIGEATKRVPSATRQKYNKIAWKAMAGMRDRLIHDYFGIDYDLVWDVAFNKVPTLKRQIEQILHDEGDA